MAKKESSDEDKARDRLHSQIKRIRRRAERRVEPEGVDDEPYEGDPHEKWAEEKAAEGNPRVRRLEEENQRLSHLLGLVESYHAAAGTPARWMRAEKKPKPLAATACLQFSDLHLDEVIDPAQVGGLNAFNREIGEMRLRRWAEKAVELGDRFKHEWEGAIIFSDGDLVSGSIHDEFLETNADYLPGTMVHWAPKIASAFRQVADFYGQVHIPVVVGNHGRLTIKKQAKGRGRNSWDWLLMQMVRSHLAEDKRFSWDFASGSYLLTPIYDRHVNVTHGDEVGGGSGWAGIWSPLGTIHRKGIEIASAHNKQISYSVIGHWHQTVLAHHRGFSLNGSLKGWDEYAASLRLRPEPAMQNWWCETREHGVTLAAPLFLTDRKAEGW